MTTIVGNKKQPTIALSLALLLTFSISLVKGGAPQWAALFWVSVCAASLLGLIIPRLADRQAPINFHKLHKSHAVLPVYLFVCFQLWALIQTWLFSLDQPASLEHNLIGLGMMCLLAIWYMALQHRKALAWFYGVTLGYAVIQSIYGLWVFISQANMLLWFPKLHYLDRPTGFFVNANHFAAFLVLSLILCLSKKATARPKNSNANAVFNVLDQLYQPVNAIIVFLLLTLIASRSIGALMSLVAVVSLMGLNMMLRSQHRVVLWVLAALCLLSIAAATALLDYSFIEHQIADLSHTFKRRLDLSQAALTMLQSHWLTGVGGGAFYSQFSAFRDLSIGNNYYHYAHNDLLQLWIEYGLIGTVILCAFLITVLKENWRVLVRPKPTSKYGNRSTTSLQTTFALASLYCTLAVIIHSLVDFPLHLPGFSVAYLTLISANSLISLNNARLRDA